MAVSSTLVVRFVRDAAISEIQDLLEENRIDGVEVSSHLRRWTIEVPVDQEERFIAILEKSEIVRHVCRDYIKGGFKPKPKREDNDGSETSPDKKRAGKKVGQKW